VSLVFQADMQTLGIDIDVRKSLAGFSNNRLQLVRVKRMEYSVDVWIYELQLAGAKNWQYLNMGHEQFVEEMHICVAKIRKILVPRSAWSAIECVLVEI
jgi:hypothetical protein